MKSKLIIATLGILGFLLVFLEKPLFAETTIGLLIQKENTATYTETLGGFKHELQNKGKKYNFVEKNAKNNKNLMQSIAQEFSEDSSLKSVVVLGSAAVTFANQEIKNKPVVFGAINHPKGLGVDGDNITGTTYFIDPAAIINLVKKIKPNVTKVGILFEPPEQNAASIVEVPGMEKALTASQITYFKEEVRTEDEISTKTNRLIEKGVQFIIIPTNSLLYSHIGLIRNSTDKEKVPVISFSRKGVIDGALIGLTSDNRELGRAMAQILIDIIDQEKAPHEIKWHFPTRYSIIVNETTMSNLEYSLPANIMKIAKKIY